MPRSRGIKKQVKKLANAVSKLGNQDAAMRKVGGVVGKALGNKARGQKIGGAISKYGRVIGEVIGSGDYVVRGNALGKNSSVLTGQVPAFSRNAESTVIEHREYVGDVVSSSVAGDFKIQKFAFNPLNASLFPWLSGVAAAFDQYEPLGAVVSFKSTSADFNATGQALGTVIIASDYDVYDTTYTSKVEMENSVFAVSCRSSESMLHPIECAPNLRPTRLLYNGPASTPGDKRFHDLCNIQVASVGVSAASVTLGELWITYRIRLHKPQVLSLYDYGFGATWSACNNNNASNYWGGTITMDTSFTNNLFSKLTFTTLNSGRPAINFVDPSTWGKTYQITFRAVCSATVASVHSMTSNATDAQITIRDTAFWGVTSVDNTDCFGLTTTITVIRDYNISPNVPQWYGIMSYISTDDVNVTEVIIVEVNPKIFV